MSKPRIYIAIATFLPLVGGAETSCLALGRSLRERGYVTTIVTFRHDRTWLSHEVIEDVPVIRVAGTLLGGREKLPRIAQKLLYLAALVAMGWTLWRHRQCYDILHIHQFSLLLLPAGLVCRLINKPMAVVVHNAGPGEAAKIHDRPSLVAGPLDATAPWLQVGEPVQVGGEVEGLERFGKPVVRFIRSLLRATHAVIIIISSRMQDYLVAHGFDLPGMQLIPNGVDITRFYPMQAGVSADQRALVVVCISRLCYQKGIDVLLQAWRLVHEQVPQAQLIIVGIGPLQSQLEKMACALGIAESVEFAGLQGDVSIQLHKGMVAVLSSHWEGMPVALLEAMACGLPCVATRVSGSEDIIQHQVNGLLVEPGDHQGLAQALLTLLHDPELAQKYGLAARTAIEKHYSLEHIIDKYVELYRKIVDRSYQRIGGPSSSTNLELQATKKPLRVLMVTGIYPTQQTPHSGTFIKTQVNSLIAAGFEVQVIHPKPGPVLLRYISAIIQVFTRTLTGRFDIVHGHYGQWCLFARMQWTTPVVASFLGSDLLGEVTVTGGFSKRGALIRSMCRWLSLRTDAVFVKSEQMKKVIPGDNAIISPDGVDFTLFHPIAREEARAVLGWDQQRYYVLFGNDPLRPEKNFPLAQAAIECLHAQGIPAELVVANGLPQSVLVQYINACNVVILPSLIEGSPNIVKEAMACNVPVVATNVGDVAQLIGRTRGCHVCPHDPVALANALSEAFRHTEPTTGRDDISNLEYSVVAKQIIAVYEQIKSKKTRG